ncbi:MAG: MFS transporter [Streptosporangiales bacterium]|nr:MFS transporter [Streptosporangiales bacterium]
MLSLVGDQLAGVAIAVLVFDSTGSPLLTAFTYALTFLPPLIGGPLLSGLADLLPRRRVMVTSDLVRAALVGLMVLPHLPLWALGGLVFLTVLFGSPFGAARAAVMPEVLPGDKYVAGSAITNITHQFGSVAGFLVGGAVVALIGTAAALAIDAMTFVLSALLLLAGVKARPSPRREGPARPSLWGVTKDGARIVFGDPRMRQLVLFAWLCGFYVIPEGLAAPYAQSLGGGAITVGVLMAAMPIGAAVGAVLFSRLVRPTDRLRMLSGMAMMSSAPLIGCALQPSLWVTVTLWVVAGMGSAYQLAANAAFVVTVPAAARGLAFGLAQSGLQAAQGLGIMVGGAAAQVFRPEQVVALAGLAGLAAAAALAVRWARVRTDVIAAMRAAQS